MKLLAVLSLLQYGVWSAWAASASEWRSRVIYQVLTDRFALANGSITATCNVTNKKYCGGTWRGLIKNLDYIQDMGFTAVWISPVTAQLQGQTSDGSSYHGYWQTDIYSLNPAFGTGSDLSALSSALHSRDMYLMVDVVPNHFAAAGGYATVDYSKFTPLNGKEYFHNYCAISDTDYSDNQTAVQDCWITGSSSTGAALADVDTTHQEVIRAYYGWISKLVKTYGIDGLRIDSVKNVQMDFWAGFNKAAGVYCVGEVSDGDPDYVFSYQDQLDGVLNYPLYYPLVAAFSSTSGSMLALADMVNTVKETANDSTLLGTFVENHDNPRLPYYTSDYALAQNAIAFTLLGDGVPIIYQGQEQHFSGSNDPYNREAVWLSGYNTGASLHGFIARATQLRNRAMAMDANFVTYKAYPLYTDTSTIAIRKGFDGFQIVGVYSNLGSSGDEYTLTISDTGYASGTEVVEILTCATAVAGEGGNITVEMGSGVPKIFYPAARMTGSSICGH